MVERAVLKIFIKIYTDQAGGQAAEIPPQWASGATGEQGPKEIMLAFRTASYFPMALTAERERLHLPRSHEKHHR